MLLFLPMCFIIITIMGMNKGNKPTDLQRKAFALIANGEKITHAMQKVGFSKSTAHNTAKLTGSKGWKQLINEHLSDDFLLKRHKFLLQKKDGLSIARGLDLAYKLKNRYGDVNIGNAVIVLPSEAIDKYKLRQAEDEIVALEQGGEVGDTDSRIVDLTHEETDGVRDEEGSSLD